MNTTTYLVKLSPTGRFAFGDLPQGEYGNRNNYFIRSNYFPQQTGVLGFLRHQLLLQNKLLAEGETGISTQKQEDANKLIGAGSFDAEQTSYGIIQYLSPVFIMQGEEFYFMRDKEKSDGIAVEYNNKSLQHYEVKKGFDSLLVSNNGSVKKKDKEIFISQEQTGIRMIDKQVAENAFYRQKSFKLNKDFCFAFFVQLQNECNKQPVKLENSFAYFGKEKSMFKMEITAREPSEGFTKEVFQSQPGSGKYLCISDVVVANEDLENLFIIGETQSFQYRVTANTTANHYNHTKRSQFNQKLLKRGSIIYGNKEIADKIQQNKAFYNIGYNHLVSVKNTLTN